MKTNRLLSTTVCLAVLALTAATPSMAQLVNGGFEANAVLNAAPVGGATGWTTFGPFAGTASALGDPTHSGIGSLKLASGGGFGVPGAYQVLPATPGQLWDFKGYMLTLNALPADATFGLLKIVWSNGTSDLQPAGATIGNALGGGNPGIESTPFLNNASTPGVWQFSEAAGFAPLGTTEVHLFALDIDQSGNAMYFDDLVATVPEPSSATLLVGGIACLLGYRRKQARS